jgi:hypothetical protein
MRTQGAWYGLEEMTESICGDWEGYCASDGYRVIMRAKELEAGLMACFESFPFRPRSCYILHALRLLTRQIHFLFSFLFNGVLIEPSFVPLLVDGE